MTAQSTTPAETQAARREQHLKEHKEEVARLREKYGDPAAALDKFILENFSLEALLPDGDRAIWEEDDDLHRVSEDLTMAAQSASTTVQAEHLEQLIKAHEEEVARVRQELGDPEEALSAFVRDTFDLETLVPDGGCPIWEMDDETSAW